METVCSLICLAAFVVMLVRNRRDKARLRLYFRRCLLAMAIVLLLALCSSVF